MAIFYQRWGIIGRSTKKAKRKRIPPTSSIAHLAYMEREKYLDERTGIVHDQKVYGKKKYPEKIKVLPTITPAGEINSFDLWTMAEKRETKKGATIARTAILALPKETTHEENYQMVSEFQMHLVKTFGLGVSASIHYDKIGNPHAHIMQTTRKIEAKTGLFTGNKIRDFNFGSGSKTIKLLRKAWKGIENSYLKKYGLKVDCTRKRKPGDRGHLGPILYRLEREKQQEKFEQDDLDFGLNYIREQEKIREQIKESDLFIKNLMEELERRNAHDYTNGRDEAAETNRRFEEKKYSENRADIKPDTDGKRKHYAKSGSAKRSDSIVDPADSRLAGWGKAGAEQDAGEDCGEDRKARKMAGVSGRMAVRTGSGYGELEDDAIIKKIDAAMTKFNKISAPEVLRDIIKDMKTLKTEIYIYREILDIRTLNDNFKNGYNSEKQNIEDETNEENNFSIKM